ncbi:MAG: DUF547 domain-containing protein [Chitinophagales bacterium]|nr:DUF547 domain-containing protein [Chitinophagales bacterium]
MSFLLLFFIFYKCHGAQPDADTTEHTLVISHDRWDGLLRKYVSASGTVNYKDLLREKPKLDSYLKELSETPASEAWTRNEQIAYWINAYNAFTVDLILRNYPVKSIRDLNSGKPWDDPFIHLNGKTYTLNAIENILREKFSDPRIHFAINCASRSCPKLMNAAFNSGSLEQQLTKLTVEFINDPIKNKIAAGKIEVSPIFNWYKNDFLKYGSLIYFINKYSASKISPDASIIYLDYDWSLNE